MKLLRFILGASLIFAVIEGYAENNVFSFSVPTTRVSYFDRDINDAIINDEGLPYEGANETFTLIKTFTSSNTAFFVIDPWNNMPSDFLNRYYGKITKDYILPLITKVNKKGFEVYIFTNDCNAIQPKPYSCSISSRFYTLAKQNPNVHILTWQDINIDNFISSLKARGIKNLIYTGFASNMCVLARPVGMVNIRNHGFSLYFIPQASAAVETRDSWNSQKIHKATTTIISQWLAKLIKYEDIYSKV